MIAVSTGVRVIAIGMRVWVIAIAVGTRVGMIAVGTVHTRRGIAIAAYRVATTVGSPSPSDTATEGDGRHSRSRVVQRREGHRAGGDRYETKQREC
jgi:hypothetical protein